MLLTQVLPQFLPLFAQAGAALPPATQFVVSLGDFVSHYGLYALIGALRARAWPSARHCNGRLFVWSGIGLLLRVPVFGPLAREVLAARVARTLGTLLQNGVPLVAALAIVVEVIGNTAGEAALRAATESAKGGAGLSRPLQLSGIFPIRMVYLLAPGRGNRAARHDGACAPPTSMRSNRGSASSASSRLWCRS